MAKSDAQRQSAKRARDKARKERVIEIDFNDNWREALKELCQARAGHGEPWEPGEYVEQLIINDYRMYQQQLAGLPNQCSRCSFPADEVGDSCPCDGETLCLVRERKSTLRLQIPDL